MGNSQRRARDADRELAVDFVEAAWADGQLTHEEYDARVDRLLRATRLSELEAEVSDLQGPDGEPWVPGGPLLPHPVSPLVDMIFRGLSRAPAKDRGQRTGLFAAIGTFVVILVLGAASGSWSHFFGSDEKSEARPSAVGSEDHVVSALHATGYRALVQALAEQGSTEVFSAQITPRGATVTAAQHPTGIAAVVYEWDGGDLDAISYTSVEAPRLDLATIDPVTVERATVATAAFGRNGKTSEVVLTLEVRDLDGEEVCVAGTLSPPPTVGYRDVPVAYDCRGRRVR